MDKIPVLPPDLPLRDRLFTQTPAQALPDAILITRNNIIYISIGYLNYLLANAANPLKAFVTSKKESCQIHVFLTDMKGKTVQQTGGNADPVEHYVGQHWDTQHMIPEVGPQKAGNGAADNEQSLEGSF